MPRVHGVSRRLVLVLAALAGLPALATAQVVVITTTSPAIPWGDTSPLVGWIGDRPILMLPEPAPPILEAIPLRPVTIRETYTRRGLLGRPIRPRPSRLYLLAE